MSQADELLATLMASVTAHEHPVTDSDSYFVIDPNTHAISNGSEEENVLMQYDHMSETYTFEIPRTVEGHDMMLCNRVRVHYIVIDDEGYKSYSDVDNASALEINKDKPDTVITTWCISRNATSLVGTLNFLVQYMCVADDGETVVYEWHTDIYTNVRIKPGMNNGEQAVSKYSDILESWYQKLFGAGDTVIADIQSTTEEQKAAIEAKGAETLATIPEDYTTTYNMASEALRTRANAIVETADGETIVANDCSDDYLRGFKMYGKTSQVTTTGKNLLQHKNGGYTQNGITFTEYDDGSIKVSGTATATTTNILTKTVDAVDGNRYILSGCPSGGKTGQKWVLRAYNPDGTTNTYDDEGNGVEIDFTNSDGEYNFSIVIFNGATIDAVFYPMLRLASVEDDTYEPYSGGVASPSPEWPQELNSVDNAVISIGGKNIIPYPYFQYPDGNGEETRYGVAIKYRDGVITLNGTATQDMTVALVKNGNIPVNGVYTLSGCSNGDTTCYMQPYIDGKYQKSCSDQPVTYSWNGVLTQLSIYIKSGDTMDNVEIRPQLEIGDVATEYEPYKPIQTLTLNRTLPGIPVSSGGNYTDSNGQQWVCDEIDFERGVYVKRCEKRIYNGTENGWVLGERDEANGVIGVFYIGIPDSRINAKALCSHYPWGQNANLNANVFDTYHRQVRFNAVDFAHTIDDWKTQLVEWNSNGEPLTVIVQLVTPIETPLSEEELFNFSQLHSNHPTTTILNDSGVKMEVSYNADTKAYFNNSRGASDEQVAAAVDAWLTNYFANAE